MVYNIRESGALGDGKTVNTRIIQNTVILQEVVPFLSKAEYM